MKIAVVGIGYVGISNGVLLAQNNEVVALDIVQEKVDMLNVKKSPVHDGLIEQYLLNRNLNLRATTDSSSAYIGAKFIIIATPTDYDSKTDNFNTKTVVSVIKEIKLINPNAIVVIKSTVPVGFTKQIKKDLEFDNIVFSPEFLREGKALYDNLYPSRIIVGEISERARVFANLLIQGAEKNDIDVLFMDATEAEAVKLFSNAYLAMRVAYFNELDSYALTKGLDSQKIIDGVGLDPRIGNYYNNPSFGYGGYCLPKDTKQLRANFHDVPNRLIGAIVDSNYIRKRFIAEQIIAKKPKIVGIYRLVMKSDSDNFRDSAIQDVIDYLKVEGVEVVIYEPRLSIDRLFGFKVVKELDSFKRISDIIVANRINEDIINVSRKVFTRDIFRSDN